MLTSGTCYCNGSITQGRVKRKEKILQLHKSEKISSSKKKKALNLCRRAKVDINRIGGGVEAVDIFQQHMKEYKIRVDDDVDGRSIFYEDPRNCSEKFIDWSYSSHHFDVIGSMAGFANRSYYCRKCHIGYTNKFRHRCPNACRRWFQSPVCSDEPNCIKNCNDCRLTFKNANCFAKHKKPTFHMVKQYVEQYNFMEGAEQCIVLQIFRNIFAITQNVSTVINTCHTAICAIFKPKN